MSMNLIPEHYIEIPADKLRLAISTAYNLSVPVGMGFLHARTGGLDEETIDRIMENVETRGVYMDYVHGRQCKFSVYVKDGKFYVQPDWYDHNRYQLIDLLTTIGIEKPEEAIEAAQSARHREG